MKEVNFHHLMNLLSLIYRMREVIITPRAKKEILNIFEYLEFMWSERIRRNFANKLYKIVETVTHNPELFPTSAVNIKFRKCVITKQVSLFYHFNKNKIVIVSVFDTRQNPNKITKTDS